MASTVYTRRDIWSLRPNQENANPASEADWDPTVLAYAKAVRAMQALPAANPSSWAFQAAIHGSFAASPSDAENCQHNSWFFLPWHRMYLWYFERIVRASVPGGAPADFALPYWDYERSAQAKSLPVPFRTPRLPDGTDNPLMLAQGMRDPRVAAGNPLSVAGRTISSATAMGTAEFRGEVVGGFGGGDERMTHFGGVVGALEGNPHNLVHVAVGGTNQDPNCNQSRMRKVQCAALDPIFWLHHANIDRLWEKWRALGRSNPDAPDWEDQEFPFYDAGGRAVRKRVGAVVETAEIDPDHDIGYVYDDVPPFTAAIVREAVREPSPPPELVAATDRALVVAGSAVSLPLVVPDGVRERVAGLVEATGRVYVVVDDIRAEQSTGVGYAVYLNLPDDGDPETQEQRHVGTMSLFGIELANDPDNPRPGLREAFEVTGLVQSLGEQGLWRPEEITVTVEPIELVEPAASDGVESSERLAQLPTVRFGQVSLLAG